MPAWEAPKPMVGAGARPRTTTPVSDPIAFLARPAPRVAPELLGWRLAIGPHIARITETEAYHGVDDRACHASKGRTTRTEGLFARPGTLYVYLCYGIHWMLNLVCDRIDVPSAVLIRSIDLPGVDHCASNGPGKVARLLGLERGHHGQHLTDGALRLLPPLVPVTRRRRGPRVGVAYAGPGWADKPWRWWEDGFPVVTNRLVPAR
jgi:DNA-3-methyladenine glycosylase